jgi:hypothetical protein
MIIRLARRGGIRTLNVIRRKEGAAELEALGAVETGTPTPHRNNGGTGSHCPQADTSAALPA